MRLTAALVQQKATNTSQPDAESDGSVANEPDQHTPRHPKPREGPSSLTVQYYPGGWKIVLERAKNRFVRHVFLHQGFPVRSAHLNIAETILHEEIARGRAENMTLDNSEIDFVTLELIIDILLRSLIFSIRTNSTDECSCTSPSLFYEIV